VHCKQNSRGTVGQGDDRPPSFISGRGGQATVLVSEMLLRDTVRYGLVKDGGEGKGGGGSWA
jgi:hypothetical protein